MGGLFSGIRLRRAFVNAAAVMFWVAAEAAAAAPFFTAHDDGNGRVLLEWEAESGAVSYRLERASADALPVSLEVGNRTNATDLVAIPSAYSYRLFAQDAQGNEREVSRLDYAPQAPLIASVGTSASTTSATSGTGNAAPFSVIAFAAQSGVDTFTARDQTNGEILLEWPPQPGAVSYRVERTAAGVPIAMFEVGDHGSATDVAGLAASYTYRLFVQSADGSEREVGSLQYNSPPSILQNAAGVAGKPPHLRSALGINLADVSYWSSELPFVDVMKASSDWISGDSSSWDNGQALDLDANGWIRSLAAGSIARKLMLRDIGPNYPAGEYIVRYQGEGTLNFSFAARVVSQSAGQMVIQVTPSSDGIYMEITATNPSNYLRDIEVIMPGGICEGDFFTVAASAANCSGQRFLAFADYSKSIVFYPPFVDRLRNYSVLRFMDWMQQCNKLVAAHAAFVSHLVNG